MPALPDDLAPDPLHQSLERGLGRHAAPPAARATTVTSSIVSSASTVTDSSGWWLRSVPFARFTTVQPGLDEDVRVAAAACGDVGRLDLVVAQRRRRHLHGGRRARQPVALEEALDRGLDVALGVARGLGRARRPSRSPPRPPCRRRGCASRARRSSARPPRSPTVPPWMRPTFAVVSGSSRPIRMRGDRPRRRRDRVVARLRADPGVRGLAAEARLDRVVGRRRDHDLADRRGVVEDVAEVGAQPATCRTAFAPFERLLLAGREQDLDPGRRPCRRARAAARAPEDRRRPRPCCPRRGSRRGGS